MAREAARLSRLLIAREAFLRKHPNMNAIIPRMFMNTRGMFVEKGALVYDSNDISRK